MCSKGYHLSPSLPAKEILFLHYQQTTHFKEVGAWKPIWEDRGLTFSQK